MNWGAQRGQARDPYPLPASDCSWGHYSQTGCVRITWAIWTRQRAPKFSRAGARSQEMYSAFQMTPGMGMTGLEKKLSPQVTQVRLLWEYYCLDRRSTVLQFFVCSFISLSRDLQLLRRQLYNLAVHWKFIKCQCESKENHLGTRFSQSCWVMEKTGN